MHRADRDLRDAARVLRIREELDEVLRQGLARPRFAGVEEVKRFLDSGRVEEARAALDRLEEGERR